MKIRRVPKDFFILGGWRLLSIQINQIIMPVMRPVKLSDPHQEVDPDGDPHFRRSEGIR